MALEDYCVLLDALDSGRLEALQEKVRSLLRAGITTLQAFNRMLCMDPVRGLKKMLSVVVSV